MAWQLGQVRATLTAANFTEEPPSVFAHFSTSFTGPHYGSWIVHAHVPLLAGDVQEVVLGIHPATDAARGMRGTQHRVRNQQALTVNLPGILAKLAALAANDAQMRCPKCNTRWVHVKEPTTPYDKQYPPFLSCDGMVKSRSGAGHPVQCAGTSKALPAVATYL